MIKRLKVVYNLISMKNEIQKKIELDQTQKLIFKTLKTYRDDLKLKTVMRVAGGWVRDKLLRKQSNDIDIALDDMKGEQFVKLLKDHSQNKQQKISSFGVTQFNPDLSKHLQTATAKIHGLSIDFVNLRSQSYGQDSRIPTIEIGTPEQDARRRDFTINSLFYNIEKEQVEDFTKLGIQDLQNGILRTPLDPYQTFKDDPLRVLRCFRFKSRFGFKIDQQIYKALERQDIHEKLRTKVSKQRIGIELSGMLKAKWPLLAFQEILKYKYWNIIFQVPKQSDLQDKGTIQKIPHYSYKILEQVQKSIQKHSWHSYEQLKLNPDQKNKKKIQYPESELQIMVPLVSVLVVYRNYKVNLGKNKFQPLVTHIAKNQLKYSTKVARFAQGVCNSITQLQNLINHNDLSKNQLVRWLRVSEEKWQLAIHILQVIFEIQNRQKKISPLKIRQLIMEQKLEFSYLVEPFIDGTFLTKRGKKGPIIRIILQNSTIWRVLNPETEKQQFLQFFEKNQEFFQNQASYN